jgi:hypothetical protein
MTDYICPECGHGLKNHSHYREFCGETDYCQCKYSKSDIYASILSQQAQALAEAREALKPFNFETWASAWDGFPDDFMLEQLSITVGDLRKAAEWLKKYP